MTRAELLSDLTESLRSRLLVHGYHLTDAEIKDVAAHLAQPLVEFCSEERDAIDEVFAEVRAAVSKLEQERESRIALDDASFDAFSAEIENPNRPTKALVDLFRKVPA